MSFQIQWERVRARSMWLRKARVGGALRNKGGFFWPRLGEEMSGGPEASGQAPDVSGHQGLQGLLCKCQFANSLRSLHPREMHVVSHKDYSRGHAPQQPFPLIYLGTA